MSDIRRVLFACCGAGLIFFASNIYAAPIGQGQGAIANASANSSSVVSAKSLPAAQANAMRSDAKTAAGANASTVQPASPHVVSRRAHGTRGTFDLPIDTTQAIDSSSITVEPRGDETGNVKRVVFIFGPVPITGVGGTVLSGTPGSSLPAGSAGTPAIALNSATGNYEVTVPISHVPNGKRLLVTLNNINGATGPGASAAIGYLAGDVNQNKVVNSSDVAIDSRYVGQVTNAANFLFDVNVNGVINSSDVSLINQYVGRLLEP